MVVTPDECKVRRIRGHPDAEISTCPKTWMELEAGTLSGIEAFASKRLSIRGSIQLALRFEPLFERPNNGGLAYGVDVVETRADKICTVVAGPKTAPPLIVLHGLGATKASWLPVLASLAREHRVYIPDLPGFGMSGKPRGDYSAAWFADRLTLFMDALGIEESHFAGNSMGGRIAQEMAMSHPSRTTAIACLCPATAFSRRPGLPLIRLLRPELGVAVGFIPRARVVGTLRDLFADPTRVEDAWFDAAADDFIRTWKSPRARMAFFAAARHIYMEEPSGELGFWERLREMQRPAFYVYGWQDPLITPHFGKKVNRFLPDARVEVWNDCGHVPQVEHPERTAGALGDFFRAASADGRAAASGG